MCTRAARARMARAPQLPAVGRAILQGREGRSLVILHGRAGRSLAILQGKAGRSLVILQGRAERSLVILRGRAERSLVILQGRVARTRRLACSSRRSPYAGAAFAVDVIWPPDGPRGALPPHASGGCLSQRRSSVVRRGGTKDEFLVRLCCQLDDDHVRQSGPRVRPKRRWRAAPDGSLSPSRYHAPRRRAN